MFKYTDVPAFAAKYNQGDRTAAVEAPDSQRAEREVRCPTMRMPTRKLIIAWWVAALARRLPSGMACTLSRPVGRPPPRWCETLARY